MRQQMDRKWKIADLGRFFRNSFMAILRGEFLMRLNVGRYFIHIAFTFILFYAVIWTSLMIESTMSKVEENKEILKDLSILQTQKTFELMSLSRRSTVEDMLMDMGSDVREPQKCEILIGD